MRVVVRIDLSRQMIDLLLLDLMAAGRARRGAALSVRREARRVDVTSARRGQEQGAHRPGPATGPPACRAAGPASHGRRGSSPRCSHARTQRRREPAAAPQVLGLQLAGVRARVAASG